MYLTGITRKINGIWFFCSDEGKRYFIENDSTHLDEYDGARALAEITEPHWVVVIAGG
jgi:hypothetical protein